MKQLVYVLLICITFVITTNCNSSTAKQPYIAATVDTILKPKYANRFFITQHKSTKTLHINNGKKNTKYILITKKSKTDVKNSIIIPSKKIITSSTTDIPFFEALANTESLIGFSETNYISSEKTRKLIDNKKIKEVGKMSQLNTELILELQPELFISSTDPSSNKNLNILEQNNTTVVYNTSWLETHPLGRAEWIKVFGHLFNKEQKADSIFNTIENNYLKLKNIADTAINKPSILSGNLYKDVWYTPAGNSFEAQLIADANGNYLWKNTKGTASLSLSIEAVLEKGQKADFWLGGGLFSNTKALGNFEKKYTLFEALKNKKVYTKDLFQGATGGIWYFEMGSLRPDLVLEDLIQIFHPDLIKPKSFNFYQKLN